MTSLPSSYDIEYREGIYAKCENTPRIWLVLAACGRRDQLLRPWLDRVFDKVEREFWEGPAKHRREPYGLVRYWLERDLASVRI